MNWDDIRIFLAAARAGQILGAAKDLGMNHATVSRRLSALEAAVGATLLQRTPSGCTLSPEGEEFLKFAEHIEQHTISAVDTIGGSNEEIAGKIRIGTPDGLGGGFLAARTGELLARYPGLQIELVPASRTFSLSRREADIAIMLDRPSEGRLVSRKLTDYSLALYASDDYLTRQGEPEVVEDLLRHRLIGYVPNLIYTEALDFTDEYLPTWRSDIAVSTAIGHVAATEAGAGIAILPAFLARQKPGLKRIIPDRSIQRSYWVVTHEDSRNSRKVRAVVEVLCDIVRRNRELFL